MDIGSEFDDDFFEKPKEKEGTEPSNYEAKVCTPLWYMDNQASGKDPSEVLVTLKHQADFHYFSKNYAKAIETYEHCMKLVPASNNTWKREFMENLSRSHLHLGNNEKALEWSLKLNACSFSPDQKTIAMNLLAIVCHRLGKYKEELEALHCCIQTHKLCPEFWLRLGLCYAGLFKIDLPESSLFKSNLENREPCCAFSMKSACQSSERESSSETVEQDVSHSSSSEECAIAASSSSSHCTESSSTEDSETVKCELCSLGVQIVSSCLIHTRVLLDSGGPNPLGIEKDAKIRGKITSSLKYMEVDQAFIDIASSMLGVDFLSGMQEHSENSVLETHECVSMNGKLKVEEK